MFKKIYTINDSAGQIKREERHRHRVRNVLELQAYRDLQHNLSL